MQFNYLITIGAFVAGVAVGLYQGQPFWPSALVSGGVPAALFAAIDFMIRKTGGKE
jgi:nitrate/nitrite transporter NarK